MSPTTRRRSPWPPVVLLLCGVVLLWFTIPIARAAMLVETHGGRATPITSLPGHAVQFHASDGVALSGWLTSSSTRRPAIILVPGFKEGESSMVAYAHFLAARYDVLLYDSRGTGASSGHFTAGPREVDDVLGAVHFLERSHAPTHSRIGVFGVSLGAGVALVAAARDSHIRAVVADSAYTDQNAVLSAMDHLRLGPLTIPLAPLAPLVLDRLGNTSIEDFRPVDAIGHIAPRPVFLIHSRHDTNITTPLSGAVRLQRAGGATVHLWIAPHGGHAGALGGQPAEYERRVLSFFRRSLG